MGGGLDRISVRTVGLCNYDCAAAASTLLERHGTDTGQREPLCLIVIDLSRGHVQHRALGVEHVWIGAFEIVQGFHVAVEKRAIEAKRSRCGLLLEAGSMTSPIS